MNNQSINDAISEQFKAIEEDGDIESAIFTHYDKTVTVNREDFQYLSKRKIVNNRELETIDESVTLVVSRLNLENPQAKWGFIYKGTPISAYIKDEVFWNRVSSGDEAFARGDRLMCNLEIKKEFDKNLNISLNKEYVITEVLDHKRQPRKAELDI